MPKASRDKLKNKGKTDVYLFDPDDVLLVDDESSALYDERVKNSYKESLVLNIMELGVIEATSGRRNPETGQVEMIDGRQRTLACREANRRLRAKGQEPHWLPVHLKRANDQRAMAMLISANEHRTEDTPMARARKAQRYIDLGRDENEVAILFGVSVGTVKNLLRLLEAPAAVRSAVDAGKISASDAYRLSREEPAEAKKKLTKLLEHAPRTPGKKRSQNSKKAREIMGRPEPKPASTTTPPPAPAAAPATAQQPSARAIKKIEDGVAEDIAAWIHETWCSDGNWDGSPNAIPERIRAGEWRNKRGVAAE